MTEPNKDNESVEIFSEKLTTTGGGMYKIAFWYYFLIILVFEVPQVNVLTHAHDFQINDSIFNSANTVSNWPV